MIKRKNMFTNLSFLLLLSSISFQYMLILNDKNCAMFSLIWNVCLCLSDCLCLSVCLFHLSICLSVRLSVYLSIYLTNLSNTISMTSDKPHRGPGLQNIWIRLQGTTHQGTPFKCLQNR